MNLSTKLLIALLATSALTQPVRAQEDASPPLPGNDASSFEDTADDEEVEISAPGVDLDKGVTVVTGARSRNLVRSEPEVMAILGPAEIARSGEGDVASALQRVTGLSVVGGRYVYVRGLGERYSLALLNGSPLPSPEPLKRVVPLDLFPTAIIGSVLIQKSFSANYPGEFGGGVINITTKSEPKEPFISFGGGIGYDSETTWKNGYTYYGSRADWTGYDSGARSIPAPLKAAVRTGKRIVEGADFSLADMQAITASLSNSSTTVIQHKKNIPPEFSLDLSAGKTFDLGGSELGVIAAASYSHGWQTRDGRQQAGTKTTNADGKESLVPSQSFHYVSTENRIVGNAMLNVAWIFGQNKIRSTTLYIHDSQKEARVALGNNFDTVSPSSKRPDATLQTGETYWYVRKLFDTQLAGEFEFKDIDIDLRGSYARSRRHAPYERVYSYAFDDQIDDYVNNLRSPGQSANISFSDLKDSVYSAGADLSYDMPTKFDLKLTGGYYYYDNKRKSGRHDFEYFPKGVLSSATSQERIDYLVSDYNVYNNDVILRETTGALGSASYSAKMRVQAGYLMTDVQPMAKIRLNIGVRYENGHQNVKPHVLFGQPAADLTEIRKNYWLPGATLTWEINDTMQMRAAGSKTVARPQFRELAPQPYRDLETARVYFGNPYLINSTLTNAEARYEWYFGRDQRFILGGFYKHIKKPIEATAVQVGSSFITSFANAPRARLWGIETEVQKFFNLDKTGSAFLKKRRVVGIVNYTFSDSRIKIHDGDKTISFTSAPNLVAASTVFDTSRKLRMTGQSKHLLNVQIGLEEIDHLSQQTLMITYASKRSTSRGPNLTPDFVERPGVKLDFIARQGIRVGKYEMEVKFEARNLLATKYKERQTLNGTSLDVNVYDRGRILALKAGFTF